MHSEYHLFSFRSTYDTKYVYPVYCWDSAYDGIGYGVVCPHRVTTNGSYRFLVGCLKDGPFTIEPALIAPKSRG